MTPVTAKYPTMHASENALTMPIASAGGPAAPMTHIRARNVPKIVADLASPSQAGGPFDGVSSEASSSLSLELPAFDTEEMMLFAPGFEDCLGLGAGGGNMV